jgi:hypothetical protein
VVHGTPPVGTAAGTPRATGATRYPSDPLAGKRGADGRQPEASPRKHLVEASVGLVQAALHARGKHPSRSFGVWKSGDRRHLGAVAEVFERGRLHRDMARHALPLEGLDDALSGRHLPVGPAEPTLAAVRSSAVTSWQVPRNPLSLPSGLRMMNRQLPPFRTSVWSTRWSSRAEPTTPR